MLTVLEIIKRTTEFLATKGVASPRLNAELLLGHVIGRRRMQLYLEFERPLTAAELDQLRPLVRRRGQQEPLQYVLGEAEFRGLRLKVDRRALIPRPETELLVELVHTWAGTQAPVLRALDLGTGSGAIAAALATLWPGAAVVAAERCPEALALARENFAALGLEGRIQPVAATWFDGVAPGPYDAIVSNPPYLTAAEVAATAPEVREHEPRAALEAPEEGLADLRAILEAAPGYLRPGGLLALETGCDHRAALCARLQAAGFQSVAAHQDLTGRDRFILAVWPG
ncbi:MAG: protein-(glutamine-N5) methyltransferase, release factor-specific [Opitutia bacterium Tous-C8FEB]|nr:MAG: protein-(glutamine-N5) methyltransferase, release factor-specific [Opitutae bacterium Tous-C8FEB]